MRKKKSWYKLGFVLLVLIGLLLLWLPPQKREPPIPHSGYDITKDDHGRYEIDRVLPKERRIFNQVVEEMHRIQKAPVNVESQMDSSTIDDPESRAIEIVAERNNIDTYDARGIFMKVSSKLAPRR